MPEQTSAPQTTQQPQEKKKGITSKWWFWLLLCITALIIASIGGCTACVYMGSKITDETVQNMNQNSNQAQNGNTANKKVEEKKVYKIGEPVTHNDLKWIVESAENKGKTLTEPDCTSFCMEATADGTFIMVLFTVENLGTNPQNVFEPTLYDNKGREFQKTTAIFDFAPSGYEEIFLSSINPGITKKFYTLYDVPEDATGLTWKDETLFGNQNFEIDLGL